ncbi:hypothetical protein PF005_g16007 [Phytophthora fragariae]|uniref:Uncharacterized protein n=1 Tax=Phytophthora fragariae TaxID=53985 RepID=A0A6A3X9D6_9STRA|nr:hypothetical protein PF003_g24609 [Phytophthora fragariae]KAE8926689.1 hypothetical protein PF009_g23133 [Phytophthora fragariae]KAE8978159.1 hypothetical protein PF011_g23362 [Phytophthora fragariae]KAE9097376.1 hypothetical protein PF010_g15988 [Phytophthora fragariae]KAE9133865.1 hypothetical protein PF006_g14942 [Phytophthora fragariae]
MSVYTKFAIIGAGGVGGTVADESLVKIPLLGEVAQEWAASADSRVDYGDAASQDGAAI